MRRAGWGLAIGLALLMAGCGSNNETPDAATDVPALPSATSLSATEVPATWTPGPTDAVVEDAPNAEDNLAGAGEALPPTWTPRVQIAPPTVARSSPPPPPARPTWTPLPDWCNTLQAVEAPGASFAQHPVHVRWVDMENVPQYRVELRNAAGTLLLDDVVEASEYTFSGDLFEYASVYGWQVTPLDEAGLSICYAISDEIVVRVPPA